MKKKTRRKKTSGVLDATIAAVVGVVILCGLGVWQLDRKVWKENLIATLNARLGEAPKDLPPRASWPRLREDGEEFRRVAFRLNSSMARRRWFIRLVRLCVRM